MNSVPFHIAEIDHGIAEADGLLRLEGGRLVFEFQKTTIGLFKSEPRRVEVALDDVQEMHHKRRRFLRDKVTITARRLDALTSVPGQSGGRLVLLVHHRHRDDLDAFFEDVEAQYDAARGAAPGGPAADRDAGADA